MYVYKCSRGITSVTCSGQNESRGSQGSSLTTLLHCLLIKQQRTFSVFTWPHLNTRGRWENSTASRVCISVETSPNYLSVEMSLRKEGKRSSIAFIKYFSKIIRQMKENAGFFYFLIEADFLNTHSYFLPANQNASDNT